MMKKRNWMVAWMVAASFAAAVAFGATGNGLATMEVQAAEPIIGEQKEGSLTIKKTDDKEEPLAGAEFTLYQVMSITVDDEGRAEYTPLAPFDTALARVELDNLGNYSTTRLEGLISELQAETSQTTGKPSGLTAADTGEATVSNLALGYYLVVETTTPAGYTTGNPFLVSIPSTNNYNSDVAVPGENWVYNVEVAQKNCAVFVDKVIDEGANGKGKDTAAVGDYVPFKVTTSIPNYSGEIYDGGHMTFQITDTMTGLVYVHDDTDAIHKTVVTVGGTPVTKGDDTYTIEPADDDKGFTLSFAREFLEEKENRGKSVAVTYYGKVTEEAVDQNNHGENKVKLTYNNGPGENQTTDTDWENVDVYTFQIQVLKFAVDGENKPLSGAVFELYNDQKEQIGTAQTSDTDGILNFKGLDEGTYYLKETKSPQGYALLANLIKVKIDSANDDGEFTLEINGNSVAPDTKGDYVSLIGDNGIAIVAVENQEGFKLPSTGGMGIGLFLLVGAAGITLLLISMKRKLKEQE